MRAHVSLLCLLTLSVAAHGQTYSIKLKPESDPGKTITVRSTEKETGTGTKFLDEDGKVVKEIKPGGKESISHLTVLERKNGRATKYKIVHDRATEMKDGKEIVHSYQGRTVVFELRGSKFRLGVVGKPPFISEDVQKLLEKANDDTNHNTAFARALTPDKPIRIGETWKPNARELLDEIASGGFNLGEAAVEAKLVKTSMKGKSLFGVFDFRLKVPVTGMFKQTIVFDPPGEVDIQVTVTAAIDGSSTEWTEEGIIHLKGKGRLKEGEKKGVMEVDLQIKGRDERSAEVDDPRGREVPAVTFVSLTDSWKEITSKEGKCSARFPGDPQKETTRDKDGTVTTKYTATVADGDIAYFMSFTDFGPGVLKAGPEAILENIVRRSAKTTKAKKDIKLNGFPGVEMDREVEVSGRPMLLKHRVFMVNGRMYQVLAMGPRAKKGLLEADFFVDSFKLQEKADK
jgi:hypothetical protein